MNPKIKSLQKIYLKLKNVYYEKKNQMDNK